MRSPETIKRNIMRRVYAFWFWREIAPVLAVEAVLLLGVAVGVFAELSLRQIMLNALSASANVGAFVQFFINNFFVKSIQSRLLGVLYLVVIMFFIRDVRRALRRMGELRENPAFFFGFSGNQR